MELLEKDRISPAAGEALTDTTATRGTDQLESLVDAVFASLAVEGDTQLSAAAKVPWVLSIDDDHEFTEGVRWRLKEHGVQVLRAAAGMEGYRTAFTAPANLILLDYELPNGNGDYVLGRLKDNPVTRDIPVIVLTGRHDKPIERKMYSLGAVCYLTKPYEWSVLWHEMQKYLPAPIQV